jgi:hypothetical protein
MQIDIFTTVCHKSVKYAELLKESGERLKSGSHKLNWKCIMNSPCPAPQGYHCVERIPGSDDVKQHPRIHGTSLNACAAYIESDYVIYVDADIALLYPSWDSIIVQELNEYDCFGADYGSSPRRYRDFPSLFFFCFRSYILNKVKLNFLPGIGKKRIGGFRTNEEDAKYMSLPVGRKVRCDTGWRIASDVQKAGFTGHHMGLDRKGRKGIKDENHLSSWRYNDEPFIAHFWGATRSSTDSFKKWADTIRSYWRNNERILAK